MLTGRSVYFSFSNNAADEVFVGFYNGGLQTPAMTLERDVWHHLVWVRTGGGTDQQGSVLYVDGVAVTQSLVPDPQLCCNGTTPNVGSTAFRVNRARDFDTQRFFVRRHGRTRALQPRAVAAGSHDELSATRARTRQRGARHRNLRRNARRMRAAAARAASDRSSLRLQVTLRSDGAPRALT
jgi:hypothetical protein